MIKTFSAVIIYTLVTTATQACIGQETSIGGALIFHAAFDGTTDANLFGDQDAGWIYTADSIERKTVQMGNHCKAVTIARQAGKFGDCLRFAAKTKQVLFYKAMGNQFQPRPNWSGSVSFWLKLDPDKDLEPGFCDPIQITQRKWNDGALWVDFDRELPRAFRLGVYSDYAKWNPKDVQYDKIPLSQKPLVTVQDPPFARDKWTHVLFTFEDVNDKDDNAGTAKLFLNGHPQGSIQKPFHFTWDKPDSENQIAEPAIMLGLNYIGDLDDLAIFKRALKPEEVQKIFESPAGVRGL